MIESIEFIELWDIRVGGMELAVRNWGYGIIELQSRKYKQVGRTVEL